MRLARVGSSGGMTDSFLADSSADSALVCDTNNNKHRLRKFWA